MGKPKPKKAVLNEREEFAGAQGVMSGLIQVARRAIEHLHGAIENFSELDRRLKALGGRYDDYVPGSDKISIQEWIKQLTKDRKSLLALECEASEMIETMQKPK